jgi:ADP-ribose pyrophosphatase
MNKSIKHNRFQQVEKRIVFSNDFITLRNDLVRFPNGKIGEYAVVESSNFSGTLCLTKNKKLVLVKQYRYPWQKSSWEISSGFIDSGETPKEAAIREVMEETGYRVINISPLIDCYPIGNNNSVGFLFIAEVEYTDSSFDTDEIEQVKEFTIKEVDELIKKGEIIQGTTMLAYYYAKTMGLFK